MVRFRSFPSRPFYSFSSAIKNLFEARDFLLSRDRRRNAPSLIPILNQRNSRTLPRLERRFFLVPLQRATLHRPMDSSFSQSNRESRAWNRDKMEFFFFSNFLRGIGLFTINNFVFSYYRQSVNAIKELTISLNDIERFPSTCYFYLQ